MQIPLKINIKIYFKFNETPKKQSLNMIKACLIQENFRKFIIHSKTFYLENLKLEILLQKTIENLNTKDI